MTFAPKRTAPIPTGHAGHQPVSQLRSTAALAGSAHAPVSDAAGDLSTAMGHYRYGGGIAPPPPGMPTPEPASQAPGRAAAPPPLAPSRPAGGHRLPVPLRHGIEQLSGIAMDDVEVHYDSPEPARLGALAYAQGAEVHLAPGQARHLPHEAWHVVQQKQGRVAATLQLKGSITLNDDAALEREADTMGQRAAAQGRLTEPGVPVPAKPRLDRPSTSRAGHGVIQRYGIEDVGLLEGAITGGLVAAYSLYLYYRPPGRSLADLYRLATAAGQAGLAFAYLARWDNANTLQLATAFGANANGLTANQWIAVANDLGPNTAAATIEFCRIPRWTHAAIRRLAADFVTDHGVLTGPQWAQLAALVRDDEHATASSFARIANWTLAGIAPLAQAYTAGPGMLDASQWAAVAAGNGADQALITTAFCRIPNWTERSIGTLATAFRTNRNHLDADQWATVAGLMRNNSPKDAKRICQLAGWTWQGILPLAKDFGLNRNNLNAEAWCNVASLLGADQAATTAALCQLENWGKDEIDALARAFLANAYGLSGSQWANLVKKAPVSARSKIAAFLHAVRAVHASATYRDIEALAHKGKYRFEPLADILPHSRAYSIAELAEILEFAGPHNDGAVKAVGPLLQAIAQHNDNTDAKHVQGLLAFALSNGQVRDATALVNTVAGRDSIKDLAAFVSFVLNRDADADADADADSTTHTDTVTIGRLLARVQAHHAGTHLAALRPLITAFAKKSTIADITALVDALAGRDPFKDLLSFVNSVRQFHGDTAVTDMSTLLLRVEHHRPATSIRDTRLLVHRVGARGTVDEIIQLVDAVAATDSIPNLTSLVEHTIARYAGATVTQIRELVEAVGNLNGVCAALTRLVRAIGGNETLPAVTAMVATAVAQLGADHLDALLPILSRERKHNTPSNVRALLLALPAGDKLGRFQDIELRIPRFGHNNSPPDYGLINYDAAGAAIDEDAEAPAPTVFHCDAWQYFLKRHSYRYFDIALVDFRNSMWHGLGDVDVVTELADSLPIAIGNHLQADSENRAAGGDNEVGAKNDGAIAHLMPLGAHADFTFSSYEARAVWNLR
ncbi:DUF4157 domain-containing protein [Burkholderia gladioli]|uniref:eCIS core domain-containing protein n=1 Tax=Burkholderia gladioli TaxID=28095 RepID=UPI00163E6B79|nr:DUF4157 domain-containing protein [Burkholderia gladioli]